MGNICRSPTAQGVFLEKLEQAGLSEHIHVDSAGTHAYHVGEQPDRRAQQAAIRRGIDLSSQRARQVDSSDFEDFDYVLAMDRENMDNLMYICPSQFRDKVRLFLSFAQGRERDVPDPYYGGDRGFEKVLDLVEAASIGLVEDIRKRLS